MKIQITIEIKDGVDDRRYFLAPVVAGYRLANGQQPWSKHSPEEFERLSRLHKQLLGKPLNFPGQ